MKSYIDNTAYSEGLRAHRAGEKSAACPYFSQSSVEATRRTSWMMGWQHAEDAANESQPNADALLLKLFDAAGALTAHPETAYDMTRAGREVLAHCDDVLEQVSTYLSGKPPKES